MKDAKFSGAMRLVRALTTLLTALLLLGCDAAVERSRNGDQSVLGTWYMTGDVGKMCHIRSSPEGLKVENEFGMTSRLAYDKRGFVTAADWLDGLRGDVRDGAILWANGTWWSRTPIPTDSQR
jgi:YD repeat-containing protein